MDFPVAFNIKTPPDVVLTPVAAKEGYCKNDVEMADWLTRLKQKDIAALELLYDRYSAPLFGRICSLIGRGEVAEQVLQSTFLKSWQCIDQYDESKCNLFTWMSSNCKQELVEYFRHDKRYNRVNAVLNENAEGEPAPTRTNLTTGPAALSKQDQLIIDLVCFYGFSFAEAAEIMRIPVDTLMAKVVR